MPEPTVVRSVRLPTYQIDWIKAHGINFNLIVREYVDSIIGNKPETYVETESRIKVIENEIRKNQKQNATLNAQLDALRHKLRDLEKIRETKQSNLDTFFKICPTPDHFKRQSRQIQNYWMGQLECEEITEIFELYLTHTTLPNKKKQTKPKEATHEIRHA